MSFRAARGGLHHGPCYFSPVRFFTSDLHFGHKNIISFCERPFADLDAMHEGLIQNWNKVVGQDDTVWILGDFVFGGTAFLRAIMERLHGRKHLLRGNHDWKNIKPNRTDLGFARIVDGTEDIWLGEGADTFHAKMCHFPYRAAHPTDLRYEELKPVDQGAPLLHGHVHCAWKTKGKMVNVGVDVWDYAPVSEATLVDLIRCL